MPSTPPMSTNSAVGSQGLHDAVVVLADLDACPDLSSLSGLRSSARTARMEPTTRRRARLTSVMRSCTCCLDHLGQVSAAGHAGLRSGHEHADALDVHDDAALVLLGDGALHDGLVLDGGLDGRPSSSRLSRRFLDRVAHALHVVDAHNVGLDGRRRPSRCPPASRRDHRSARRWGCSRRAWSPRSTLNLGGGDAGDDAGDLVSRI